MGIIDWLMLLVLLIFTIQGFRHGLVGTLLQIAGSIAAFFLVGHYYPLLRLSLVGKYHLNNTLATVISVLLILALIAVVVRIVIYLVNKALKALHLSTLNKLLGLVLGFANGLLILIVLTVALDFLPRFSTPLKDSSRHRVYAAVDTLKEEAFTKLKLKQRKEYLELKEKLSPVLPQSDPTP